MAFASSADFEAAVKALAVADPNESETTRLEKWEKKYGFYSLRADYAKKQKEKEAKAASDAQTQRLLPDDGGTPPPVFEPYEEPWDEGLIIEDDLFAAMLSPDNTVQIGDKVFHIDLPNNIVSYIPTVSPVAYTDFVGAQPSVSNEQIRYFGMNEDVFALLEAGNTGTAFGVSLSDFGIGSGIGCGPGAKSQDDKAKIVYAKNKRLDCKLVYQHLGIYHSIVAKAHHQKQTWYGVWLGSPEYLIILTPSALWQPKCQDYNDSDFSSYSNLGSPYLGDGNGDHNTVTHRYWSNTKGLKRYKVDVRFRVQGVSTTRIFHIEDKW